MAYGTARCHDAAMVAVFAVLRSPSRLLGLILMHSGRDAGFGGMGFTPASQGGTHIVERNLTRLTVVVAALFFVEHRRALPAPRVEAGTPLESSPPALVAELVDAQG